ncbi:MAG: L,D-transpeptidase [Alphaproteobacteria bacterium]|nr:MAG: L,D-transpeptidase [Alphaproteobacteria bacterium]
MPVSRRVVLAGGISALALSACTTTSTGTTTSAYRTAFLRVPKGEEFPVAPVAVNRIPKQYHRQIVRDPTGEKPGTIVVDPSAKYLYLVQDNGKALRYGIGVGRQGFSWNGEAVIKRKAKWPNWYPPKPMQKRDPLAAKWAGGMPGGPTNPLGARALYLYRGNRDTLYRIHGTGEPSTIGQAVSSGCIRLLHADVIDLYERVPVGTRVVVLPAHNSIEPILKAVRRTTSAIGEAIASL